MASPILSEGPCANNVAAGVFHSLDPHETSVFHTIHNFAAFSCRGREKDEMGFRCPVESSWRVLNGADAAPAPARAPLMSVHRVDTPESARIQSSGFAPTLGSGTHRRHPR